MGGGDNEIVIKTLLDSTGFTKGSKQLERAIKGMAATAKRLATTVLGVSSAYAILSRAVNAYMAQNEKLTAKMNSIWTALGNVLGPIINQIINWVTTAVSYFLEFLRLLGVTSKTASQLSKAAKSAGGDLQKTLAGFDELNLLNKNGGGGVNGRLDDVDPNEWMKKLAELIKSGLWDEAATMIIQKMNDLITKFHDKANEFGDAVGEWLDDVLHAIARVVDEVNWSEIGDAIGDFLVKAFRDVNGEDIGTILVAKFTIAFKVLTGFLAAPDLGQTFGRVLSETIIGAINSISGAIKNAKWDSIGENIREFFANIDWTGIRDAIYGLFENAWNAAIDLLKGLLGQGENGEDHPLVKACEKLGDSIKNLWEVLEPIAEKIIGFFEDLGAELIDKGLPNFITAASVAIDSVTASFRLLGIAAGGLLKVLSGDMSLTDYLASLKEEMERTAEATGDLAQEFDDGGAAMEAFNRGTVLILDPVAGIPPVANIIKGTGEAFTELGDAAEDAAQRSSNASEEISRGYGTAGRAAEGMSSRVRAMSAEASEGASKSWGDLSKNTITAMSDADTKAGGKAKNLASTVTKLFGDMGTDSSKSVKTLGEDSVNVSEDIEFDMVENIQNASTKVVEEFSHMKSEATRSVEELNRTAVESFEDIKDCAMDSAKTVADQIRTNFSQAADVGIEQFTALRSAVVEVFNETREKVKQSATNIEAAVRSSFISAKTQAVNSTDVIRTSVQNAFSIIQTKVKEAVVAAQKSVQDSFSKMQDAIKRASTQISNYASTMTSTFYNITYTARNTLGNLASQAYWWGRDLMIQYDNGMQRERWRVDNEVNDLANRISDWLGFSEPEEGPLSDFHTYAPDMMQLYAKGIRDNTPKVMDAVSALAEGVSDAVQDGDYAIGPISVSDIEYAMDGFADKIVDGFTNLVDRLQAIADNVTFAMPAVAGGGVVPYSVGGVSWNMNEDNGYSRVAGAVERLEELIGDFRTSVESMQWVAQFGNMRAVVEQITTVQNEMKRQGGR